MQGTLHSMIDASEDASIYICCIYGMLHNAKSEVSLEMVCDI